MAVRQVNDVVQAPQKALSLEDFLELPETKPASEYVDGQIIQKPVPQGKHSALQGDLVWQWVGKLVHPLQQEQYNRHEKL